MLLFILGKLILQTHMCSHPVGLDVWFLVGPFVYFHTLCVWTAKALARQHKCAGSPESSVVAHNLRAGSFVSKLKRTDFVRSWDLWCQVSMSETNFHCSPEKYFRKTGHPTNLGRLKISFTSVFSQKHQRLCQKLLLQLTLVLHIKRNSHFIFIFPLEVYILIIYECQVKTSSLRFWDYSLLKTDRQFIKTEKHLYYPCHVWSP